MILLSSIIKQFESSYKSKYSPLPSHLSAINAMKTCRTSASPQLLAQCKDCNNHTFIPHSCGHRNCPHCQAHESQQWIENQLKAQVPANYFMVTFTLPKELRETDWRNQKLFYNLMFECSKDTLQTFTKNDKKLGGTAGLMSVIWIIILTFTSLLLLRVSTKKQKAGIPKKVNISLITKL